MGGVIAGLGVAICGVSCTVERSERILADRSRDYAQNKSREHEAAWGADAHEVKGTEDSDAGVGSLNKECAVVGSAHLRVSWLTEAT